MVIPPSHFIFVDFENVPDVDLSLVAGQEAHVTLLIGKNQHRLDLALVRQIHRLASQVTLEEVGGSGRNALDLTLACYLGQAIQRTPAAHFYIVSKDRDFEPMIAHLVSRGTQVMRCEAFHRLPFVTLSKPGAPARRSITAKAAPPSQKPVDDKAARLLARLANPTNKNRPATEKALRAHINTGLGKNSSPLQVDALLRDLREREVLTIGPGGTVTYAPGRA